MVKPAIKILIFAGIILLIYGGVKLLIPPLSHKALHIARHQAARQGMMPYRLTFQRARLLGFHTIEWNGFSASIRLKKEGDFLAGRYFELNVPVLRIDLPRFKIRESRFSFQNGQMSFYDKDQNNPNENVVIQDFEVHLSLDFFDLSKLRKQAAFFFSEMIRLFAYGKTKLPLRMTAISDFTLSGESVRARLEMQKSGEESILIMNEKDLLQMSEKMADKLRPSEVKVISRNPLRAPRLLQIRDRAVTDSQNKAAASPGFPEDAYRHILWSYLLAREYGETFAKEVTDAHEQGGQNTDAERLMDLKNNETGRRYAGEGLEESDLIPKILNDPAVMRAPGAVYRPQDLPQLPSLEDLEPAEPPKRFADPFVVYEESDMPAGRVNGRM